MDIDFIQGARLDSSLQLLQIFTDYGLTARYFSVEITMKSDDESIVKQ